MDRTYSIPDEVLELILLRLDSPISLIRAASTSKRWRRIVTAAGFLRRFASDQGQPTLVAGTYYNSGSTTPIFCIPSTSLIDGGRFSLDFLQSGDDVDDVCPFDPVSWRITDSRGSRLLLAFNDYDIKRSCLHMIVCEPLTRRRHRISFPLVDHWSICTWPFFLDADADGGSRIDMSIYRLVLVLHDRGTDHNRVVMFSSDGSWKESSVDWEKMEYLGHTNASLYWYVEDRTVVAMDRRTAEFETSELPAAGSKDWDWERMIVAACRDGQPRIIINGDKECGALKFFARSQDGSEWALEKMIQLLDVLPGCDPSYFYGGMGWVRVTAVDMGTVVVDRGRAWGYRLDIETMEAEQAHKDAYRDVAFPCELPWPPAFHACSELINVV